MINCHRRGKGSDRRVGSVAVGNLYSTELMSLVFFDSAAVHTTYIASILHTDKRHAQLTRLETRTKELNFYASERVLGPVAQRKRLLHNIYVNSCQRFIVAL
jgi:hypothetical protein